MTRIKTASSIDIGYTDIIEDEIIIHNNNKPELRFKDEDVLKDIRFKIRSDAIIKKLYDVYYLSIAEIASLYGVCYANMNKQWKKVGVKTHANEGRRNRSYGKPQSEETKKKISQTLNEGYESGRLVAPPPYERTPEIREKTSKSLKEYFKNNPENPEPHIQNWKNGVYDKVDFHHGIGGHYFSIKNNQVMYFRSLLELCFILKIEEDPSIDNYCYENLHITCDNGHIYTPDYSYNKDVIELKSKKYVNSKEEILSKFLYKKEQAEKYCAEHGLNYKVIFDTDLDFESRRFKRYIENHPEIVEKYSIVFNQPERMVNK